MQYLLTQEEYRNLQNSNPNLEEVIVLLETIKNNPYSDGAKLEFFKNFTKDLMDAKPQDIPRKLGEWRLVLFPH